MVTCISRPRRPACIEGISERVYAALTGLGLANALQSISAPVPRRVIWNGDASAANTERLIDREAFDSGVLADLEAAGVNVVQGTIERLSHGDEGWEVVLSNDRVLCADFLVEARGRRAPHKQGELHRGPESIALGQFWQLPKAVTARPSVQALSLAQGWGWLVQLADGRIFTQLSLSATRHALPERGCEAEWIRDAFNRVLGTDNPLVAATPRGQASFRGCTSLLNAEVIDLDYIRIGDAAMAVDPLSGNGIFQSLSSALVAPAVINTLIRRPADRALAQQFYEQRLQHLFMRFARLGRDFYRQVASPQLDDYWLQRQSWPDNHHAHPQTDRVLGVAQRPVLNNGFIELADVLLTENQPLGIWMVDGEPAVERYRRKSLQGTQS